MREELLETIMYFVTLAMVLCMGVVLLDLFKTPAAGSDDISVYQSAARGFHRFDGGKQ